MCARGTEQSASRWQKGLLLLVTGLAAVLSERIEELLAVIAYRSHIGASRLPILSPSRFLGLAALS
jgi:hypothetical protein